MPILVMVPRVVQDFLSRFPATHHNAYGYFNYDNRVVEERVPRGDICSNYQGPDDLTNADYQVLVDYAKTIVNPILAKYSSRVANEDALTMAIRSFRNGLFDGKVNANRYDALLKAMCSLPVRSAKGPKPGKSVKPSTLKQLGLKSKDLPVRQRVQEKGRKTPMLVRERGRPVLLEKEKNS